MQYAEFFKRCKSDNFGNDGMKKIDIFLIFSQNIDCGYTLEQPHWGNASEYPQSMFKSKNKKKLNTCYLYKSGLLGVYITRTC